MTHARTPDRRCARLRARVAAWLRVERGDTLVEVLIAAVMVALIAAATLNGFAGVAHLSSTQRHQTEATALAQQDEARLRGLTISQLGGGAGNGPSALWPSGHVTVDGTTYTVTSKSQYISGSSSTASCTTGPTTISADVVAISSSVTWTSGNGTNDNRNPVVIHGVVAPSQGGSLVVVATDGSDLPLSGVTATLTGPTTVAPLTTDASGCSIFGGLAGGAYTVTFTDPGTVDINGNPPSAQSVTVVPTRTTTVFVKVAQPGAISATFTTNYSGSSVANSSDTFVASNTQLGAPGYRLFGTDSTRSTNSDVANIVSPTTEFPFAGGNNSYSVYAGSCPSDAPPSPASVVVTPSTTSSVAIPEPAMIVLPWGTSSAFADDDRNAALTYSSGWTQNSNVSDYSGTTTDSATTNNSMTFTFYGTSVQWIATKAKTNGIANVSLDGAAAAPVDLYAASTSYKNTVYSATGLTPGSHTLTITVSGTKNASATGYNVSIDEISGTAVSLLTTRPTVTVTDTGCGNNEDYPATQIATLTHGALVNPGEPYATFTVCADNGTNHNTATVPNTSFTAPGNIVNIALYAGATGLSGGTCP